MLFDIRGRRKHVVRVVYAILALLMGASLFLVVGPFNVGNLINNTETSNAGKVLQEQAQRLEAKLQREPESQAVLASLTRTHLAAGNAFSETSSESATPILLPEGRRELEEATVTWKQYLKQADSVDPTLATLVARGYFSLAESSAGLEEAIGNVKKAADAQSLAAEGQPTLNSLTTLAIYAYYAGDFSAGDKAAKQAEAEAPKAKVKEVEKLMGQYRKRGKEFEAQKKEFAKVEKEEGKEALKNPFGGLGGSSGGLGQ